MMDTRLEQLREENELTKKSLSSILNVSDSIYARWESGKDIIPTRRLYQIANYYKVNIDYILKLTPKRITIHSDDEINMDLVASRVSEIRKDFNESLRTFADRLNTSNSTWSAYETGKVLILCAFLIEVCKITEYSADWILGRTDEKYRV